MAVPTSYTEETLAAYMKATIGGIALDLEWTDLEPELGHYVRPVNKVTLALDVSNLADSDASVELIQLEADVAIWSEVVAAYVRAYAVGGLARNLQRQQLWEHARVMLQEAQAALAIYKGEITGSGEGVPLYSTVLRTYVHW